MNLKGIPIDTNDAETAIMVESALDWIAEHTTLDIDAEAELPANVKLFIVKFCDIMSHSSCVASESLGGMSQSFSTNGTGVLLSDLAAQLFGSAYKGRNKFVSVQSRWK